MLPTDRDGPDRVNSAVPTSKQTPPTRGPGWKETNGWESARDLRQRQTSAEAALWRLLRGNALGVRFRRQHPIGPFVVDFLCSHHALIIELDGSIHADPDVEEQDIWRQTWPEEHGYRVIRIPNSIVTESPVQAVLTIREAIASIRSSD